MNETPDELPATAPPGDGATAHTPEDGQQPARLDERVLAVVCDLARELRRGSGAPPRAGLEGSLERDFGLDSLARVELFGRIERQLAVRVADAAMAEAETVRDLLGFLEATGGGGAAVDFAPPPGVDAASLLAGPDDAQTIIEVLEWHVAAHPDRVYVYLYGDAPDPEPITYAALLADAMAVAGGLRVRGAEAGDQVAIMLPTGRDFLAAFYGIMYAGCVPVPVYPPARPSQLEDHLRRIAGIIANSQSAVLVTFDRARSVAGLLRLQGLSSLAIATVSELSQPQRDGGATRGQRAAGDLAFLQYTSGSTGEPKGVALTHRNLLANLASMREATGVNPSDVFVSWLPLYHDMGLIGAVMGSLYIGFTLVLMSPLAFLARPSRWLRAIHRHRGTLTAAPNFAYEFCLSKVDERELEGLDLSSLRMAFNGAEAVMPATISRFAERFAGYGLRHGAITPVYGLAESSVGLAFPPQGRGPRIEVLDRTQMRVNERAVPAAPGDPRPLEIVACGLPLPGHEIRAVDAAGRELPERHQGRIQFRGPSSTSGYFRRPELSEQLCDGDWLNTGDLGFLADGELFLTGRAKDIIIRGGHNIHPQELEDSVSRVPGVRKGGVCVFPLADESTGTERLVVMAETDVAAPDERARISEMIRALSVDLLGTPADEIVLAPPRAVLKTSSGKIRRSACRELYQSGHLGHGIRPPWVQLLRLAVRGLGRQAFRIASGAGSWCWAAWVWALFSLMAVLGAALILVVPGLGLRRALARALVKSALWLSGLPVAVIGREHLVGTGARIVAANHASYVDWLVLGAVLPASYSFVAKQELASSFLLGKLLRRMGTSFVERFDATQGIEDTRRLEQRLRAGDSLALFPEGTFRRSTGLLPFRMGAFVLAARTATPIVTVALRGTRWVLRDLEWFPRRAAVTVTVSEAIAPRGDDWAAAIELRAAVHDLLLEGSGEPDTR